MRFTACVLALLLAGAARAATVNVAAGDVAGLVSAVQTANANPGPDIVELSAGATYTLTVPDAGSDGLPAITSDVTIHGHGATIARAGGAMASFRVLEVGAGGILRLDDATIAGGDANPEDGGAILVSGAGAQLVLAGVTVHDSTTVGGRGGGVAVTGAGAVLTLSDTTVRDNTAVSGGGMALLAPSDLGCTRCRIAGNLAVRLTGFDIVASGGGILADAAATVRLVDSTVDRNAATTVAPALGPVPRGIPILHAHGAGLADEGGATWHLERSTVSRNDAGSFAGDTFGGGIYSGGSGTLTLVNVTISGNSATVATNPGTSAGGGVYFTAGDTVRMNDVTIADNRVSGGKSNGGGLVTTNADVRLLNTIIGQNSAVSDADCFTDIGDAITTLVSDGFFLLGDPSGCSFVGGPTDIDDEQVRLGDLGDNGGPTETQLPLPDSPAIDHGSPDTPGSGGTSCDAVDQRAYGRPAHGRCDIGAVEVDAVAASTTTSTTTTASTTTTSTTLPGCGVRAATFASILCRLDLLIADVNARTDLSTYQSRFAATLGAARARTVRAQDQAAAGKKGRTKATRSLKAAARRVGSIVHRLESRNGKRKVGEAARNDIAGQANPIQADMKALQKSL